MSGTGASGPLARGAIRLYAQLVRALPARFREEYGAELRADFRRLVGRSTSGGAWRVVVVSCRSVADLLLRVPVEHWNERIRRGPERGMKPKARDGRLGVLEMMRTMGLELRWAARSLAMRPGFTVVAALTLALGIGANVAIFAVVNAVLLRPLPYPDSDDIVVIGHHAPGLDLPELEQSPGTYGVYRDHARSFAHVAVVDERRRNLTGGGRPARVQVVDVTPSFFDVVRTQPALGRRLVEADAQPGAAPVAVLLDDAWRARFAGSPEILGTSVELDGVPTEIVGVMPEGFTYPDPETVALLPKHVDIEEGFGTFGLGGLARLAPGVDLEAANREVAELQTRFPEFFPNLTPEFLEQAGWSADVTRLRDEIVGDAETPLWVVLGTVGFVLLIACANVANLFLVRAESRGREVAIRAALGASRGRLLQSFLSESVLLGLLGGAVGMALAAVGVRLLVAHGPPELPRLHEVGIDADVLLFGVALSLLAGLAFGALPALRYLGRSFVTLLREGRASTAARDRHRVRKALITAQVALALVLLVGSGLMLRSFWRLRAMDPGFDPRGVVSVGISLGDDESVETTAPLYQRMVDEVRALPGVEASGATNSLPIQPSGINGSSFDIESRPRAEDALPPVAMYGVVTPGFFETMRVPRVQGRPMERSDHEGGPPVVWVNRLFAERFLDGDALGERVRFGNDSTYAEIVGVVGDVRTFGLTEEIRPMAYLPMTTPTGGVTLDVMQLVVRSSGDPRALIPAIRRTVAGIDPDVPLTTARTMDEVVASSIVEVSFTMTLLAIAALMALLLGAIGLYGVISYVVAQRTREIGVRIALGARAGDVRRMVVRQGVGVTLVGVLLGVLGALALTRLLGALLFEVSTTDPLTFIGVVMLLVSVSLLASYLPARRASAISPVEALRAE